MAYFIKDGSDPHGKLVLCVTAAPPPPIREKGQQFSREHLRSHLAQWVNQLNAASGYFHINRPPHSRSD